MNSCVEPKEETIESIRATNLQDRPDLAPVEKHEKHEKLKRWAVTQGGYWHEAVQIIYHPSKGYYTVVADGKTISAGSRVASCPISISISALNALNIEGFSNRGSTFPPAFLRKYETATDLLQHFFLIEQYLLGEQSFWHSYIDTLPTLQDVDDLQYDDDADYAWICGTNLEAAFAAQTSKWQHQFSEGLNTLSTLGWSQAKTDRYSFQLYRWAATIFGSRSFTSSVLSDTSAADLARPLGRRSPNHRLLKELFTEKFGVLLPLVDLCNHGPLARVEWQSRATFVGLQVLEDYSEGQEILNNYGPRDNEGMLMSYGFVLPENPYEHVLISIHVPEGSPLQAARRSWFQDDRSNELYNCYIFDTTHPLVQQSQYLERTLFSYDLLDSISIMSGNDRELQSMYTNRRSLMSSALPHGFEDYRNFLATLAQIMFDGRARARRIHSMTPSVIDTAVAPTSQKQINAQIYRKGQIRLLGSAVSVCAFALIHSSTGQTPEAILRILRTNMPEYYNPELEKLCKEKACLITANELFTVTTLQALLPNQLRTRLYSVQSQIESLTIQSQSPTSQTQRRMHIDKTKTAFSFFFAFLCHVHRSPNNQLPPRLTSWITEICSSYPPEDESWSFVPSSDTPVPGEEPPPGLMTILNVLTQVNSDADKEWISPKMICWGWNVMEEEGVRLPAEIERMISTSEDGANREEEIDGEIGFLMYCKQY